MRDDTLFWRLFCLILENKKETNEKIINSKTIMKAEITAETYAEAKQNV